MPSTIQLRQHAVLLIFFYGNLKGRLVGGKKKVRDSWYGLSTKSDFGDFRRWFHREGKDGPAGDVANQADMNDIYEQWVSEGRPKVK